MKAVGGLLFIDKIIWGFYKYFSSNVFTKEDPRDNSGGEACDQAQYDHRPRSAPKIFATATGPVGGIKAWVTAKPAKRGRA